MQNSNYKVYLLILGFSLYILGLSGCATVPVQQAMPTYNINATTYVPLANLCQEKGFTWDYDSVAKTVTLNRGTHRINLQVGDSLALIDGRAQYLHHPVDFYQGAIIVPYKLKERLDSLFGSQRPSAASYFPAGTIKKVVIDAGHGGNDPGTIGRSGIKEKNVNLDVAKRIAKLLRDNGVEVVMTRSSDVFIELEQRSRIANNAKADLFISVHANANRVRSLNGLEVYYVSPKVLDSRRALNAAQNSRLDFSNACFYRQSKNLKAILWDMIYTYNRGESINLARDICKSIQRSLDTRVIGVKSAGFQVLKGTNMPAVLVEIGFLSNAEEERMIKNGYYRQQLAEAIVDGITSYARYLAMAEAN